MTFPFSKKTFRRENVMLFIGSAITVATTVTVLGDVIIGFSAVNLNDLEFVVATLYSAGAAWGGIGSYHRIKRSEQRGEDNFDPDGNYRDPHGGEN